MNDDKKAFPSTTPDGQHWESGMSLRDYFAASAMQGMLASGHQEAIEKLAIQAEGNAAKGIALAAYGFADAMLKARETF